MALLCTTLQKHTSHCIAPSRQNHTLCSFKITQRILVLNKIPIHDVWELNHTSKIICASKYIHAWITTTRLLLTYTNLKSHYLHTHRTECNTALKSQNKSRWEMCPTIPLLTGGPLFSCWIAEELCPNFKSLLWPLLPSSSPPPMKMVMNKVSQIFPFLSPSSLSVSYFKEQNKSSQTFYAVHLKVYRLLS